MTAEAAATVHTSAPDADLFAGTPDAPPAHRPGHMELTGRLAAKHVATMPLGVGAGMVRALVLELEDVGPGHYHVTAHITYPLDRFSQADEDCARLRKGQRITVATPFTDLRLLLPAASLIPQPTP